VLLLRDTSRPAAPVRPSDPSGELAATPGGVRIRCPLCSWRHDFQPHWMCEACLTTFDTFRTRAHCPACDNSWRDTWCPRCHRPSAHEAWYVPEDGGGGPPA
jgi:hypothetical protein